MPLCFRLCVLIGCGLVALGCQRRADFAFSGTLEVTEHAVGARVAARIAALAVDEGDEVRAGQVIATLDRYEQMAREHERNRQLAGRGGVAKETLEHSQLALDDQQIVAPIDGT
ncbi:MAG: biotin/lipoyl-binding protein, partial [Deltaproteobacteria bacterium]|nr:biotin/lipoyl-binding protein [Deltaproteobacteria bacterium]